MFEQASIDTRGMLRSPWAITVSVAGQALLLSAGIVVSIFQTDTLPRGFAITRVAAPWTRQKSAEPAAGSPVARPTRPGPHPFFAPSKIRDLQAKIGELTMENSFLEGALGKFPGPSGKR